MSRGEGLQHAPWWLHAPARRPWQEAQDPEALAGMLRMLLNRNSPDPAALTVARTALNELEACFSGDRAARDERLRALWRRHGPEDIEGRQRIGVPVKLWERLLDRLRAGRAPGRRCWLGAAEREGLFHQGVTFGCSTEWWGLPAAPGATYDDRLWAWGAVHQEAESGPEELAALSARLVWRSDGTRWIVHPRIQRAVARSPGAGPLPRLDQGPGYLLACIVDALAELLSTAPYTSRDLAALWATMLLPLLAPSIELEDGAQHAAPDVFLDGEPDYLQTLAFFMLHPRIQTAIVALDRLCTLLLVGDHASLHQVLVRLERPEVCGSLRAGDDAGGQARDAATIRAATARLIADVAEQALHRRAAPRWDSGFGFKLFRKLLRDVLSGGTDDFARLWDAAVHGEPSQAMPASHDVGVLAQRLREALSTALWFPGRPPYPGGPAVQQLLDLTWLRWIDEDFLT